MRYNYAQIDAVAMAIYNIFQFLHGTIKAESFKYLKSTTIIFQFFLVQLKLFSDSGVNLFVMEFQFLHGTIKAQARIKTERLPVRFQFLHGTIKAIVGVLVNYNTFLFQFLHGTIKAWQVNTRTLLLLNFNSYMVQLKR